MFGPELFYGIPGLILTISMYAYAKAKVADNLGDPTPRYCGRLTLNPLAHIDPIGLLVLLFLRLGWSKPIPINWNNFANWRSAVRQISIAGPVINIIMAFVCCLFMEFVIKFFPDNASLLQILYLAVIYNVTFAIFNLIPIPPLDGFQFLGTFLSQETMYKIETSAFSRYSFFILLALLLTGIIGKIVMPISWFIIAILSNVAHLVI